MSLFGSLFSGVSGLTAQSRAMGMISDNVANVNTTAYKGATARFSTLVTGLSGARSYSPGGVRALTFQTVSSQGLIQGTASPTDAAISGPGFFVVSAQIAGTSEPLYTRAGAFEPDSEGNLRTPSGFYLQGWALDASEQVADANRLETVNINRISGVATATTEIGLGANLDADQADYAGTYAAGDMAANLAGGSGGVEPQFSRPIHVYDSLGREHDLTVSFLKQGPAASTWRVEVSAIPGEVDAATHPDGLVASGTVTFNGDGSLATNTVAPALSGTAPGDIGIRWAAAQGAADSSITLGLGTPGENDGLTQFASPSNIVGVDRNGAPVWRPQRGRSRRPRQSGGVVHQRREPPHLQAAGGDLPQPDRARGPYRQRLQPDRILGRIQPAARRGRRCRQDHPVGPRIRQCRPGRGVHPHDHHPAGLFGQRQGDHDDRRDARRADATGPLSGLVFSSTGVRK